MRARTIMIIAAASSIAAAIALACGDDDGGLVGGAPDAGDDAPPTSRDARPSDPDGSAPVNPFAGWIAWNGYAGCKSLRIPPSAAELPSPPNWESCSSKSPAGCRRMVLDWATDGGGEALTQLIARVGSRGERVTVVTNRIYGEVFMHLVLDIDGPVHFAISVDTNECYMHANAGDGDRFAFEIHEKDVLGKATGFRGVIAGRIGELAPVMSRRFAPPDGIERYVAARDGVGDGVGSIFPWTDAATIEAGVPFRIQLARGEHYFARTDESVSVFSLEAGTAELLHFSDGGSNEKHFGTEFGTDGTDLVWIEANHGSSTADPPLDAAVYASPYATASAAVQSRLLRSDIGRYEIGGFTATMAVGCGYAARSGVHDLPGGGSEQALTIIRLSDGAAWFLPSPPTSDIFNYQPFAVTCTEVLAVVQDRSLGGRGTIVRQRIDALGTPTPP